MVNFKKFVALALSATMIVGGSMTAFAAAPTEGSQDGSGSNEGHVNKEIVDVLIPTTTTTSFAYTMDPERLITATDAAKYAEGTTFPIGDDDTGVYFLTATNTYANTSNKVQAINKGAVAQMLTVTAKLTASEGGKDIAVLTEAPDSEATTPGLYLAAKVAGVTNALSTTGSSWIINVPGNEGNYEVAVKDGAYVFQKKTSGLTPWKAADIEVTGAVTNGIAVEDGTTAPKITLTWKFEAVPQTAPSWTAGTSLSDFSDGPATTALNAVVIDGNDVYVKIFADNSSVDASKLTSFKLNNVDKTPNVLSNGVIELRGAATEAGTYNVTLVYDGTNYAGSGTKQ
ncbi:hypothetical protein [Butyrivibrio sp. AE3006]|uniref:hypothetical protein n=1 Tax=Butyrivibrio sp. AE3006 TaxID=1280673 RepID=UPI00041ED656|nr:hypothetical protein [Butyrivibrio sp. AE3006]